MKMRSDNGWVVPSGFRSREMEKSPMWTPNPKIMKQITYWLMITFSFIIIAFTIGGAFR